VMSARLVTSGALCLPLMAGSGGWLRRVARAKHSAPPSPANIGKTQYAEEQGFVLVASPLIEEPYKRERNADPA
jgi:hypothetical protein